MKKKAGKNWKSKSFQTSELVRIIAGKDNKRVLQWGMDKYKGKRIPISDLTMKNAFMLQPQSSGDTGSIEKHYVIRRGLTRPFLHMAELLPGEPQYDPRHPNYPNR